MPTTDIQNKSFVLPDMDILLNSIKEIKRAVPALKDGAYGYFADEVNMASTLADKISQQITDALTTLPMSLEKLKEIEAFAQNIAKINVAEKAGEVDKATADKARGQMQQRLNQGATDIITSFEASANNLSETATRISGYADKIPVRLTDAYSTETANRDKAAEDVKRESARVTTLQARYDKLTQAVDEKRGGPVDELLAIIPDEKELASLVDVGAEDAAAPEAAAAKKAVELAVAEVKKVLEAVNKTIEFVQLAEMRDDIFKALQEQRVVSHAANDRLIKANKNIAELDKVKVAGVEMKNVATEVNKIVSALTTFINNIKSLDGSVITENTIIDLYNSMHSYFEDLRSARSKVILV